MKRAEYKKILKRANLVIITSSICIGILSSIPKLFRLHMGVIELGIDVSIFSGFTFFVWFFNLYNLPSPSYKTNQLKNIYTRFALTVLLGSVVMALFVTVHQLLLPKYPLASMMGMYEFRGLIINITIGTFLYFFYQNHVTGVMESELEGIKMDHLNARFELLKQQVNPHFLFNSLSTLKSMVDAREEKASEFIDQLSRFYRSSLEKSDQNHTRLSQELKLLESYLYLLKTRYEEGLTVQIAIPPLYHSCQIPPFTLQLLVENAVKHNIVSPGRPLEIKIYIEDDFLMVRNDIRPRRSVEPSSGIGLKNIKDRYHKLFNAVVAIEQTAHQFCIKLPLIYEYRNS